MRKYTKWIGLATAILGMSWSLAGAADGQAGTDPKSRRSVARMDFGKTPDGTPVELYVLTNGRITVKVMTYGAIVTEIRRAGPPGEDGGRRPRLRHARWLPRRATRISGRSTGRVANRIAQGRVHARRPGIHSWPLNNGPNTLHGGLKGFDKVVWKAEDVSGARRTGRQDRRTSARTAKKGIPGNLSTTRDLHPDPRRRDQDRLRGHDRQGRRRSTSRITATSTWPVTTSGTILDHELMIAADQYTPVDDDPDPDRRDQVREGDAAGLHDADGDRRTDRPDPGDPVGYDHNYVIRAGPKSPAFAARVRDPKSGRVDGDVHHRAGRAVLHGQLPGRHRSRARGASSTGSTRRSAWRPSIFPTRSTTPTFPRSILRPGPDVHPDDDLQVLRPVRSRGDFSSNLRGRGSSCARRAWVSAATISDESRCRSAGQAEQRPSPRDPGPEADRPAASARLHDPRRPRRAGEGAPGRRRRHRPRDQRGPLRQCPAGRRAPGHRPRELRPGRRGRRQGDRGRSPATTSRAPSGGRAGRSST